MNTLNIDRIETPIGAMVLLAQDDVLLLLEFEEESDRIDRELRKRFKTFQLESSPNPFGLSAKVSEYFAGNHHAIDNVATEGGGTAFENSVWQELKRIQPGHTVSYGELAKRIGNPNAMRAVGLANGKNPIAIVVPCHRVVGADGTLTGYGGGLHRKEWLLKHEGALLI